LRPAEPFLLQYAACRTFFVTNAALKWIWVWDPCFSRYIVLNWEHLYKYLRTTTIQCGLWCKCWEIKTKTFKWSYNTVLSILSNLVRFCKQKSNKLGNEKANDNRNQGKIHLANFKPQSYIYIEMARLLKKVEFKDVGCSITFVLHDFCHITRWQCK